MAPGGGGRGHHLGILEQRPLCSGRVRGAAAEIMTREVVRHQIPPARGPGRPSPRCALLWRVRGEPASLGHGRSGAAIRLDYATRRARVGEGPALRGPDRALARTSPWRRGCRSTRGLWAEGGIASQLPGLPGGRRGRPRAGGRPPRSCYLRRLREGLMFGRKPLDRVSALLAEARGCPARGSTTSASRSTCAPMRSSSASPTELEEARRSPSRRVRRERDRVHGPDRAGQRSPSLTLRRRRRRQARCLRLAALRSSTPRPRWPPAPAPAGPTRPDALAAIDRFGTLRHPRGRGDLRPSAGRGGGGALGPRHATGSSKPVTAMTGTLWERV